MERSAFCTKNTSFLCMDMTASAANAVEEGMRPEAVNTSAQAMPPYVEANYKPVVAVVFAIILLVAGVWSSRRRPWKGGKDGKAVVNAFVIVSLPFILCETATGIMSSLSGELKIPPLVGLGVAIDLIILLAGLGVAVAWAMRAEPPKAESPEDDSQEQRKSET